jgi:hypothetical protein
MKYPRAPMIAPFAHIGVDDSRNNTYNVKAALSTAHPASPGILVILFQNPSSVKEAL